jgi:hypothetical protein
MTMEWSGRNRTASGTRETCVARFVVGYAKVNRCRAQSAALPCTLHPDPDPDPDLDLDPIALVEDSWRCTDEQEYEEDQKAEGANHFLAPGKRGWSVSSRHLSSFIRHLSSAIRHLPSVICHLPSAISPSPFPVPNSAFSNGRGLPLSGTKET